MTTNYLIWGLVKPSHALLALLLLGGMLALMGRRRAARVALAAGLAGVLILGVLPTASWLLAPLENRFPEPELPPRVDGIIVLAGPELPENTAGRQFPQVGDAAERLIAGVMLARKYPDAVLVHSGQGPVLVDAKTGRTSTSDVAHDLFTALGVDERRLVQEDRSTNTCESAREIANRFDDSRDGVWLLVTSAAHMPRSVACFRAHDWSVIPVPVDYRQPMAEHRTTHIDVTTNLQWVDCAAHEWLGLLYYRLLRRTKELFPGP